MRFTDTFRSESCFDILLLECSLCYVINIFKSKHITCTVIRQYGFCVAPLQQWYTSLRGEGTCKTPNPPLLIREIGHRTPCISPNHNGNQVCLRTQNGSWSSVHFGIAELTIQQYSLQVDIRIQMHTSKLQTCHASSCALPVTRLLSRIPTSHPLTLYSLRL